MKGPNTKKMISLVLCLILSLSLAPVAVSAEEEDEVITVTTDTVETVEEAQEIVEEEEDADDTDAANNEDEDSDDSDEDEADDEIEIEVNDTVEVTEIDEVIEFADEPIPISVLILPKFEVDEITGDFPGEAQYYYDAYCAGGDVYKVRNASDDCLVYVKGDVALFCTGIGKVNAAQNLMALLTDPGFDFSETYILATGCAGGAREISVPGDVFLVTGVVDYDLGHHADPRDMEDNSKATWFHDEKFDSSAYRYLDSDLMDMIYPMIQDISLSTTEETQKAMAKEYDDAEWATRKPGVFKGTSISGDNYWKSTYDEENAILMAKTYEMPDPYATTEMEDIAIAITAERMDMLDNLIILRDVVNMDVFPKDLTPEKLWNPETEDSSATESTTENSVEAEETTEDSTDAVDTPENSTEAENTFEDSLETIDIFQTAMENNFKVGSVIIDAILNGEL